MVKNLELENLKCIESEIIKSIATIEQYQEEVEFMYVKDSQLYIEKMDILNKEHDLARKTLEIIVAMIVIPVEKKVIPIKKTKKK